MNMSMTNVSAMLIDINNEDTNDGVERLHGQGISAFNGKAGQRDHGGIGAFARGYPIPNCVIAETHPCENSIVRNSDPYTDEKANSDKIDKT